MAKLQASLHGQILSELELQPEKVYFAGRGAESDIPLENQRGISRQHLKFYHEDGIWKMQLLSKFGGVVYSGQSVEAIHLQGEVHFSVPPYEFYFSDISLSSQKELALFPLQASIVKETAEQVANETSKGENLDTTAVGTSPLVAYLKINNTKVRTSELLKLEGNKWTLGRHQSCEIFVNDPAISRKHFEITKISDGYNITGYSTPNGTKLNGNKIEANVSHNIRSGDVIAIRHLEIIFEIHDSSYEKHLAVAPQFNDQFSESDVHGGLDEYEHSADSAPAAIRIQPKPRAKSKRPNLIQIAIGAIALVLIFSLLFKDDQGKNEIESKSTTQINPENNKQVVDTFNLAKNYYYQHKYVLCLSQISKLHTLVPFYSNSKEIESLCQQAQELEQMRADQRRKDESKLEVENKIRSNIEHCKNQLTPKTTSNELSSCLEPALELDPQNGAALELLSQVQIYENTIKEKLEKSAELARRKQEGKNSYLRALNYQRANRLKAALKQYRTFLNGQYPGLNQEEDAANRSMASISNTLDKQLKEQVAKCEAAAKQADLKNTIITCDKVIKENPGSKQAQEVRNKAYSLLQREMKTLYEDSRIEESLGNIESAKEKWLKIIEKSVPQDDYYKKAKINLKKYGIGM